MSVHASTESLSLYLDGALAPAARRRVEHHLGACPECRHRLDGLHRVVAGLARLPAAVPPDDLAERVGREVELRGRRRGWAERLAQPLPSPLAGAPPLHMLALVVALAAIVYLFAFGVERYRERPTRIVLPPAESAAPAAPPAADLGGRLAAQPAAAAERRHLLGGVFRQVDGVWVEEGLEQRPADERFGLLAPAAAGADLAALAELGAPLRMRVGDRVVEVEFAPGS